MFPTRIEFIAHFQTALPFLILMNACQLEQVHQVSQITVALSVQFVRGSSVWIVGFLGIHQWAVKSTKTFHWKRQIQRILHYIASPRVKDGGVASSVVGWLSLLKVVTTWPVGKISFLAKQRGIYTYVCVCCQIWKGLKFLEEDRFQKAMIQGRC